MFFPFLNERNKEGKKLKLNKFLQIRGIESKREKRSFNLKAGTPWNGV